MLAFLSQLSETSSRESAIARLDALMLMKFYFMHSAIESLLINIGTTIDLSYVRAMHSLTKNSISCPFASIPRYVRGIDHDDATRCNRSMERTWSLAEKQYQFSEFMIHELVAFNGT